MKSKQSGCAVAGTGAGEEAGRRVRSRVSGGGGSSERAVLDVLVPRVIFSGQGVRQKTDVADASH